MRKLTHVFGLQISEKFRDALNNLEFTPAKHLRIEICDRFQITADKLIGNMVADFQYSDGLSQVGAATVLYFIK